MTRQLPTTIITTSYAYTTRLHQSVTIGALASYLSRLENNIQARTFEIARALPLDMRVQAINMQAGDRLLIANDPIKITDLPSPPREGAKFVRVKTPQLTIDLPSKQVVTIGWTDKSTGNPPDVDLRRIATPEILPYIAPNCLELEMVENQWMAQRIGSNRIVLDELDIFNAPVRLNPTQQVKIYAPNGSYPILEFQLLLETVNVQHTMSPLATGTTLVGIQPGIEGSTRFIRASERLTLRQIIAGLAQHDTLSLGNASIYLAHALPLQTPLHKIADQDAFLHVPLETRHARRVLKLEDQYNARTYSIRSGRTDRRLSVGWRSAGSSPDASLDVDLFPSLLSPAVSTRSATLIKAHLNYSAFAETWSISTAKNSPIALFLNDRQVGNLPMRISVGDTISFGTDPNQSIIHLKADITVE